MILTNNIMIIMITVLVFRKDKQLSCDSYIYCDTYIDTYIHRYIYIYIYIDTYMCVLSNLGRARAGAPLLP